MSDLGSEELEEEGENDLGVRAPGEGGASRGARGRWTPEAEVGEWGGLESSHSPPGREARQGRGSRRPQRAGAAPWESTVEGKTL